MLRLGNTCLVGILAGFTLLAATSVAQSGDDLPSAPSVVIQQKNTPPTPPPAPPKPADPAPEATPKPATQTVAPPGGQKASVPSATTDNSDIPGADRTTIKRQVNEVSVVFTVTDKHNRYVKDLTQADFKVIDD